MARKYHAIWRNEFLSSDTIANLEDYQIVIFLRLLLIADDWGRFPDNPMKLKRMASDFSHDTQQYSQTINRLTVDGCIERYEVNGEGVYQFDNWDKYFVLTWKDDAQFPNSEGVYERSNNPGATGENKKNKSKKKTTTKKKVKLNKSNQIKAHDSSSDSSPDKDEETMQLSENTTLTKTQYQKLVQKVDGDTAMVQYYSDSYSDWIVQQSTKVQKTRIPYNSMNSWINRDIRLGKLKIGGNSQPSQPRYKCPKCGERYYNADDTCHIGKDCALEAVIPID